jgi:hypothetical protein
MVVHRLENFTKGWFVGDFQPSIFQSSEVEIGVKMYEAGEEENSHHHKVATELTCVVQGTIQMNDEIFSEGDIVEVLPHEVIKFKSITRSITVVVKSPSIKNDKYENS